MPTPTKEESRDDYLKRCIPIVIREAKNTGEKKTPEQAAGQCGGMYDQWKKKNK